MLEFFLNIASSAYFAMGASIVIIVSIVLIIVPIMDRIKKLDDIVKLKLSLLPTSNTYSDIIEKISAERQSHEAVLNIFQEIEKDVNHLKEQLIIINDVDFAAKMGEICEVKTQRFLDELNDLEKSLSRFSRYIRDNEKRSEIQINNLVAARIDTTDVLIDLLHKMRDQKIVEDVDISKLYDVKRNLQRGFDSIQHLNNYKVLESNDKSGNFNRFIDEDY